MLMQDGEVEEHVVQDEHSHATHHFDLNEQAEDEDNHDEPGFTLTKLHIGNQTFYINIVLLDCVHHC